MKKVVSLSGGKDSTAMLLMMLERHEEIDDILFFDFGMEFPEIYTHLERLERYTGKSIHRIYPQHSFEYYMFDILKVRGSRKGQKGYGWPAFRRRWCTRVKTNALAPYCRNKINCIGISASEPRRMKVNKKNTRYPLVEYGMTSQASLEYCYSRGFDFGGLYERFDRGGCFCCPFQDKKSLLQLRDSYPQQWKELLRLNSRSMYPWPNDALSQVLKSNGAKQGKLFSVTGETNEHNKAIVGNRQNRNKVG